MNLDDLSQLYYLDRLIQRDLEKIQDLEDRMQPGAQVLTGMPRRPGASDTIGDIVPSVVDLRDKLTREIANFRAQKSQIEAYIDSVKDCQVRLILTLRFVDLKKWNEIADLVGGDATESSVKKMLYRFVRRKKHVPNVPNVPNVPHVPKNYDTV